MDEAVATNAPWEIMGARHGGITVSDLDRSLEFYVGLVGLELVWRREYVKDEIREIVGIPDATSVDIAMLDIPGGGAQVELLEYKGCERKSGSDAAVRLRHRPLLRVRPQHRGVSRRARRAGRAVPLRTARSRCWRGRTPAARASTGSTRTATSSSSTSGRPMSLPDVASAVAARPADRPPLIDQFRLMLLIRAFEERAATLFEQGVIFGTAHSCVGQEAIAVGAAGVMRETDYLVGHHRSHGHLIAAGADLHRMMAEMFGKRTGYCKGLGGSMHIADLSLDILGCNGIVGAGIPHACGAALTATLRGTDQATLAFFGDGAAGQGATHEGMNLAATWKLPVVFICENNQFALSADWRTQRAVEDLADRAAGYGMPGEVVDGNDVLAVEDAVGRALDLARSGGGPTFLEMKTFRRMQHSMRANLPDVRDRAVIDEWEPKDPVPRFEALLREAGELDDERRRRDPRRGRGAGRGGRDGRPRRRGRERRRPAAGRVRPAPEPPGAARAAATASSRSWARFARRSTSSSPPTRT